MSTTQRTVEIVDLDTPEGRAKARAYKEDKAAFVREGQQLYARIKRSSKYYDQTPEDGSAFAVRVIAGPREGYLVQGGPGGQYRLRDVHLYIIDDGEEVRIT